MRQIHIYVILCDTGFCEQLENYQIKKKTLNSAVWLPSSFLWFFFVVHQFPWLHKLPGILLMGP